MEATYTQTLTPRGTLRNQRGTSEGYGKGVLEQAMTFFFSNFPDDWRSGEMWEAFIKCGRVIDVYVAKKKDKWGRSFGFVRFLEVKNSRDMELKLNQIKVGQRTIQANVARFSNVEDQKKQKNQAAIQSGKKSITVSYAEAVKNGPRKHEESDSREPMQVMGIKKQWRKSKANQEQWQGLEVMAEEEDLRWLQDCFVGTVKSPETISTLQDKFLMEGYFSAKVTPMGGRLVLLSSVDHEELKDLVDNGKDWLAQWFSDVRPWKPTEVASERFTWLRCQGVPVHIWRSSFFETVAHLFRKFISLDDSTIKKKSLGKQLLWKEILDLMEVSDGGNWCIGGDFNAIRSREEKRGRHFNNTAMRDFNSFIDEAGLEDLPMSGRKFTWFKTDGSAMSRLDRFLVSTGFLINFPDLIQKGLCRDFSDHYPRRSYFQQVWEWNSRKDSLLCQKSRQKWLQEGDANSKYFHGCIVKRRRRNGIEGVVKNEAWVEEVPEVKKVIKELFELKFQEQEWDRPSLELNQLKQLSPEDNSWLTAEFSKEEVKAAVWNCNGSKSPGPDGFNFNFIKKMWPTIKQDIVDFVKEFWANGRLVKGSNSSFIVLIPKKESPQGLGDYRPISLVGCLYKIISKLLANRLRKVMPTIISQNQSAFVGKRFIADGIVIANEIVHEAKKRRRPTLIFKADFEKAYDSVNWKFLELMMEKFGFCLKWRKWIKECLSTSSVSVLVNGSPTAEFSMEKGLRQGDPLAPFLFLLVAEALNELIYKAKELNLYKGVEMGEERLEVTHLQFADDSIFFCDASDSNIKAIKGILRTFELVSGLKVNFFKSALYGINVKAEDVSKWAESLNCMVGAIPFKYLGVPVGANPRKFSTWAPVIDCLRLKLSGWKCESLSFGGRIVLLNAVLSSIPVYFFAIMRAPIKVTNLLTSIQRRFLWGGREGNRKIAWVSWEKVCRSRKEGGLGVKDLVKFNMALLGKWRWRLMVEKEALWNRVVEAKYGIHKEKDWEGKNVKHSCSSWWKAVWKLDKEVGNKKGWVYKGLVKSVGEGNDTLFWKEKWCGKRTLKEKFNRLYKVAVSKEALIKDMGEWRDGEWSWNWGWRRELMGRELSLLQDLEKLLKECKLMKGKQDFWSWKHDSKGNYSTKSAYSLLNNSIEEPGSIQFNKIWNSKVPLKVSAFVWKLLQDRIPTGENLLKRGMAGGELDFECIFCGKHIESTSHLFFTCEVTWAVWQVFYAWWGQQGVLTCEAWKHLQQHTGMIQNGKLKEAWYALYTGSRPSLILNWLKNNGGRILRMR
ncbi:hypothetical protein SLEP1_g9218 [Rubroshorea leprosula]|uniref:Uncharacterized protein n=1 Tax=Rubroshorea leprosula TaxID=152421 RepID=A0AAV5I8R6_9ROSI|nr:hypothetical protein SLEP1_g9218 [Rubroshorea leprosula]